MICALTSPPRRPAPSRIFHDDTPTPDPTPMQRPGLASPTDHDQRPPDVLKISTFGLDGHDRFGMDNRQAQGLSGRPPQPFPLTRLNNIKLYRAIRGGAIGACDALADQDPHNVLVALVRMQRIAAFAVQRFERARGREVLIVEDTRDVTVVQIPGFDPGDFT